jgi:hypothetical protein
MLVWYLQQYQRVFQEVSALIQINVLRSNKEAKVNNFYKIEEALRFLKVKFDAKLINNIMNEERGCALRLLY